MSLNKKSLWTFQSSPENSLESSADKYAHESLIVQSALSQETCQHFCIYVFKSCALSSGIFVLLYGHLHESASHKGSNSKDFLMTRSLRFPYSLN